MQKDQNLRRAGGLAEGLRLVRGTGWGCLGGDLHVQGGFEEGLRAPGWRQGSRCSQSVCDLLPTTKGSQSLPPTLQPFLPPNPFFVLIVPTVSSGRGMRWRMEAWEGASPLCATGVYMSAADVERVKRERERGWETVPPHSNPEPPLPSPPLLLFH